MFMYNKVKLDLFQVNSSWLILDSYVKFSFICGYSLESQRWKSNKKRKDIVIFFFVKDYSFKWKVINSFYFEYDKENIWERNSLWIEIVMICSLLDSYIEMKDWKKESSQS